MLGISYVYWDKENMVTVGEWETPFADRRWGSLIPSTLKGLTCQTTLEWICRLMKILSVQV